MSRYEARSKGRCDVTGCTHAFTLKVIVMAETKNSRGKGKSLGKYCVAGGPGTVSCKNNSKTGGISMHRFPSDSSVRKKWTSFVQRHRAQWMPTSTSVLCSAHFVVTDFEQRLDLNLQNPSKFTTKRWLKKGSIPSVDCVVLEPQVKEISARERRQVICINCFGAPSYIFIKSSRKL